LLLWHGWSGSARQALSRLVDQFNSQSRSGRILLQSTPLTSFASELRSQAQAGSGPHLALIPATWVGDLGREGVLLPLDQAVSSSEQQAFLPVTISGARAQDRDGTQRLYGLPLCFDTLALFYNQANILVAPEDTDVLLQLARGLQRPGLWGLGFNLSIDQSLGYLYAFGGQVFNEQGEPTLAGTSQQATEQWLTWLAQLNADPQLLVRSESGIQVDREVKNGRVAMSFGWAHQLPDFRRLWKEQLGIAPLPKLAATDQTPKPYVLSQVLTINQLASPAEQAAALEFVRFVTSVEAQQLLLEYDLQPARQDVALAGDTPQAVAARAFRTSAEQGLPMPNGPERDRVRQELRRMLLRVLSDQAQPRDAVLEADLQLRLLLNLPAQ
jgi:maltose-binding protein MalE